MPVLVAAFVLATGQINYQPRGPKIEVFLQNGKSFLIQTDRDSSPQTVTDILKLVRQGYYDAQKVHRIESWIVQWGDPKSRVLPPNDPRNGKEVHGIAMIFEAPPVPFDRGIVGIHSARARTGGDGQIFIVKKDAHHLGVGYSILGKVIVGMDVVDSIRKGDRIARMVIVGRGF